MSIIMFVYGQVFVREPTYSYLCREMEKRMNRDEFYDDDFGVVKVKVNPRARNIIFYNRADGLHVTVPLGVSEQKVRDSLHHFRSRLLQSGNSLERKLINPDFFIEAAFFRLRLLEAGVDKFMLRQESGRLEIICPFHTDFGDEKLQSWLHRVIEEQLRKRAKLILPQRIRSLSEKYNLPFEEVKINSSKGRWGSCSSRKRINLSYYLLLLPAHLIDYVLLHELCHTKEMNHSDRFWKLMDAVTDDKALILRRELRKYKTDFV